MPRTSPETRGRPAATSHGEIEQAAFRLFVDLGFEATTLEMIAAEVGISRRTIARYYPSKNDIAWGQFDLLLADFADLLATMPADIPVWEAVRRGIVKFNQFPEDAAPPHRDRMRLIRTTPALVAHSTIRYRAWLDIVAGFVAGRLGMDAHDLLPQTAAQSSLAIVLSAYDAWLDQPDRDLGATIEEAMADARTFLAPAGSAPGNEST